MSEEFWDYLYSEDYSGGCSVRILEGQLLEYLMTSLFVLQRSGEVVNHKTFAFARNERERRGCYKLANQRGCGVIKETLLIDLTYYGRSTRPLNVQTSEWSYPETTTTSDILTVKSELSSCPSIGLQRHLSKRYSKEEIDKVDSIGTIKEQEKIGPSEDYRRFSSNEHKTGQLEMETIPMAHKASWVHSDDSSRVSTESDYRLAPQKINLQKFLCTEKITDSDESEGSSEDGLSSEDETYGEEFYLSDVIRQGFAEGETINDKLKKRKEERIKERADIDAFIKSWQPCSKQFGTDYKQFDADKDYDMPEFQLNYNFLTKIPTLEEYVCLMEDFEKVDPRYKKHKQITKKVAKQYKLEKASNFGLSHMVTAVSPSMIEQRDKRKSQGTLPPIDKFMSKQRSSNVSKTGFSPPEGSNTPSRECSEFMAEIVGGITDSKPCEKHVADQIGRAKRMSPVEPGNGRWQSIVRISKRQQSVATSPNVALLEEDETQSNLPSIIITTPYDNQASTKVKPVPVPTKSKDNKGKSKGKKSKATKTTVLQQSGTTDRAADTDDEKYVEESVSVFDTSKLNCRYSFEKLKGKNYHKKKPAFYNVLKKYYRMHTAVTAFNEPAVEEGKRRKSILERIIDTKKTKRLVPPYRMLIGKIKKFSFQAYEKQRTIHTEAAEFKHICMKKFQESLLKALDDFVVRRELVISSYGTKVSTTITFTKKSVFQKNSR